MTSARIAVTAAAGKTGSALVRELRRKGPAVRALVRRRDAHSEAPSRLGAEIVETDLVDGARMVDAGTTTRPTNGRSGCRADPLRDGRTAARGGPPDMNATAALFVAFVAAVAAGVGLIAARRLPARTAVRIGIGLALWLAYVGILGASGVIARRPPAIVAIVAPVVLFVLLAVARSRAAGRIARAVPLWILIGFQADRIGVELFLHALWNQGLVPRMLTYDGANVDIWIGASAPIAAWVSTLGRGGRRVAVAWNAIGLLALVNVIVRSVLTSPGPLHLLDGDVANRAIGTFPYTFIAGFLAPLAITLHVLALRASADRLPSPHPTGIPA